MSQIHAALPTRPRTEQRTCCDYYMRPDTISVSHDTTSAGWTSDVRWLLKEQQTGHVSVGFVASVWRTDMHAWTIWVTPSSPLCESTAAETHWTVSHDPVGCNRMQRAFSDPPKEIIPSALTFTYSPGLGRHEVGQREAPWMRIFLLDFSSVNKWFKEQSLYSALLLPGLY